MFRDRRRVSTLPNYVILTLMAIFAIVPILLLLTNSLKSTAEINLSPFTLPSDPLWDNFSTAWDEGSYARTIQNSAILTSVTVFFAVSLAGMAAYALARLNLKGGNIISFYFLVGTGVPAQLFIIPLFFMWKQVGLINSHLGLIIIYVALQSPFATYLLRSYMVALPQDFIDAARIDGASNIQVLRHIILPLSWPGFLTAALVVGLFTWNEFLFAVTFLHRTDLKPISTSLYAFQQRYGRDWGLTNAGSVIMILPVLVLFLLLQRNFIEGLTQGGLKA